VFTVSNYCVRVSVVAADLSKAELLKEIDRLKEKVEYERQPSIVFENENDGLQQKVCAIVDINMLFLLVLLYLL